MILRIAAFIVLTLLTQIGGVIFALALLLSWLFVPKTVLGWTRGALTTLIFIALYLELSLAVVPRLAAAGGRVPLSCHAEPDRPFAAGHRLYCVLNRHYVDARLVTLLSQLSRAIDRAHPGTVTLYLDGNFPFLDGFPLPPHLSHNDG